MILPVILGFAVVLLIADHAQREKHAPAKTTTVGHAPALAPAPTPALDYVMSLLAHGAPLDPVSLHAAIADAKRIGRVDIAHLLVTNFVAPALAPFTHAIAPPPPAQPAPNVPNAHPPQHAHHPHHQQQAAPLMPPHEQAQMAAPQMPTAVQGDAAQIAPPIEREMLPSPFRHIDSNSWTYFVKQLECEPVDYATKKHIGRFRQRRDRLAELNIPLPTTPDEQYAALKADVLDAYRHADRSGLFSDVIARPIDVDGRGEQPVTASGVLGVIQAAGLEGASEWFTNPEDRKRFPGTTKVFLQTNGAF